MNMMMMVMTMVVDESVSCVVYRVSRIVCRVSCIVM